MSKDTATVHMHAPDGAVWRAERPRVLEYRQQGTWGVHVYAACVTLDRHGLAADHHRSVEIVMHCPTLEAAADLISQITGAP